MEEIDYIGLLNIIICDNLTIIWKQLWILAYYIELSVSTWLSYGRNWEYWLIK